MKRMAIAGLLAAALALAPVSQQKAAAWGCGGCGGSGGGFSIGIGISIGFSCHVSCTPSCGPCLGCGGCGYNGMAFSGYGSPMTDYGACAYGYPAAPAPMAAPTATNGVQTAAYAYPAAYGYGYAQAPSYWYGR